MIFQAILLAISLCADCFAVTACSSITLKSVTWRRVLWIALVFAVVQTAFLLAGWLFGDLFAGFLGKAARTIGFLLLLYVGGSMIFEGLKGKEESRNLDGFRNIVLGAVATSFDALAVGASMSLEEAGSKVLFADLTAVFVVTMLSVFAGMTGGYRIGRRFGHPAEIVGGIVLICIGIRILFA